MAGILRADPDVVLLDVHMPAGGGRGVIEGVRSQGSKAQFLALSVSDAAEDVIGIIRAGARGYVTKSISADELVAAVQRVHDGDVVFSPRLAGFVLDAFAGESDQPIDPELDLLTVRERETLRFIARGYTYKEVAVGAAHLGQDRRDARLRRAAQAPAIEPIRAHPLGIGPPPGLEQVTHPGRSRLSPWCRRRPPSAQ